MWTVIKHLRANEEGNFAILTALLALPLTLSLGAAIDLSRHHSAQMHLQDIADAASLAMAISREELPAKLRKIGEGSINSNLARGTLGSVNIDELIVDEQQIDLRLSGTVETTFMGLAGFETMPVEASALAKREATGTVEVALVLDNTYSMIGPGTSGEKIASLKEASAGLVETLMTNNSDGAIRIGLVPYADYVNVGVKYRNASWLAIEPRRERTCRTIKSEKSCKQHAPTYSCKKSVDGIEMDGTCGGQCIQEETIVYTPPKEVCDAPDTREWYGCVGSRKDGPTSFPNRVHDQYQSITYPGLIDSSQKCLNPIVTLTDNKRELLEAIKGMVVERPWYRPLTYIPSGLIWGQNMLSASQPLSEAADYDPKNRKPRKIMILMTDGANTMMFHPSSGRHGEVRGGSKDDSELSAGDLKARRDEQKQTNADSLAICNYAKSKQIEIYTVAFMVDTAEGKALMRNCASSKDHYFDAADRAKLNAAFQGIADSISRVRLAR